MIALLLAHLASAAAVFALGRRRPLVALVTALVTVASPAVLAVATGVGAVRPPGQRWRWVDGLGLSISFRLDGLAVLMVVLVSVLGALVLAYSWAYFDHDGKYVRFLGLFVAFAGAMTGLVLSDDLFSMFVFWELTSVCSFLLIGLNDTSPTARASALRALLVTGAGGLALLGGVLVLQVHAGTTSFAGLAAAHPRGVAVDVAIALVLVGAFTKSAQVPFHFWLPGAMAAPTPVSAYLHSATMVKAGIVLMARLAPVFGDHAVWRWPVVLAGGTTMLLGGARALRQVDAKLILAHSTVSQLGLLTVLVGLGVPGATYAGVAHLVAHALFKACLFLGVGAVDHAAGTRDIRRLHGLGRRMPVVAGASALAALSMAGVIPMFGFATKEHALVALFDGGAGAAGTVALVAVVLGSVLSVAYSVRVWFGLFGGGAASDEPTPVHHAPGPLLTAPVVVLAGATALAGLAAGWIGRWFDAPARALDPSASGHLALWPGVHLEFVVSTVIVVVGAIIGWRLPRTTVAPPPRISGERAYQHALDGLLGGARRLTVVTQSGSLVAYVGLLASVVVAAVTVAIVRSPGAGLGRLAVGESVVQVAVIVLAIVLAFGVVVARRRFVSALLLGGVGTGCAVVFALHGAPDLALTQVLVEALSVVVFVLVLRQMPRRFAADPVWAPKPARVAISVAVGVGVALFAVMAADARTAQSSGDVYTELSEPEGGGRNVVNVILVDFRGTDTLGEITVLGIAALGVTNLVRAARRRSARTMEEPS
jgi:multicomponent Na+:H+ antiporter subunit A